MSVYLILKMFNKYTAYLVCPSFMHMLVVLFLVVVVSVAALQCHMQAWHSYYSILDCFLHSCVDENISRNGAMFTKTYFKTTTKNIFREKNFPVLSRSICIRNVIYITI